MEVLNKINTAEVEAKLIIDKAKEKAMLLEGKKKQELDQEYIDSIKEEKNKILSELESVKEDKRKSLQYKLDEADNKADKLKKALSDNVDKVVCTIVDEIVKGLN